MVLLTSTLRRGAMKIIRKGRVNVDKPWVGRKIRCSNCDFLGVLESDDKVKLLSNQREGVLYSVICPDCKAFMSLALSSRN